MQAYNVGLITNNVEMIEKKAKLNQKMEPINASINIVKANVPINTSTKEEITWVIHASKPSNIMPIPDQFPIFIDLNNIKKDQIENITQKLRNHQGPVFPFAVKKSEIEPQVIQAFRDKIITEINSYEQLPNKMYEMLKGRI